MGDGYLLFLIPSFFFLIGDPAAPSIDYLLCSLFGLIILFSSSS